MPLDLKHKQVVSKKRVLDHGEVYTSEREVKAMLDLVKQETERIESRFLEPACGTGNFLTEILERKLSVVESRYGKNLLEFERKAVIAIGSLYGIDILEDNVIECRKRLLNIFEQKYRGRFKKKAKEDYLNTVRYILERNILHGDALTLKTVGEHPQPIVFSEWSAPFNNSMIKRRDYIFSDLLPDELLSQGSHDMFAKPGLVSDLGERAFIPEETRSYPPIPYLKIGEENDTDKLQP